MENKDIKMDCANMSDGKFSRKFKALMYIAIFYTGVLGIVGIAKTVVLITGNVLTQGSNGQTLNSILWEDTIYVVMIFCFVSLIKIAATKRPFSGVLVNCLYAIGILLIVGAVTFPLLPLYEFPSMIMGIEGKPYIDGLPFVVGILILIFGKIVHYGFVYQKEIDTII